jgi:hypothetical protein
MTAITLQDCAKQLKDVLAPHGFVRKSSTWRRDVGEFMDVIEFQRDHADFTVNVGVLTKTVYEVLWSKPAPALAQAPECTIYVGQLSGFRAKPSGWWDLTDPAALLEVADIVRNAVLPFMERMHARAEQRRYLRETKLRDWSTPFNEAILMFESGEHAEACTMLRNYKNRYSKSIEASANEIADRLGCPKRGPA